jgi:alkylation response protein AidB-like acyl-CoA dehydrogenase
MTTILKEKLVKGGEFLIMETDPKDVFIPEEWSEEQKMIYQTCLDFVETEIHTKLDQIDSMKYPELVPSLLDKAGQLGLLGSGIPEKYGGFGMDFNTTMLIAEAFGQSHSFVVSISVHIGIGTLPILFYGTEQQKEKYLPKLAMGELKSAYCLTEPDAGSDANAGKTKARLSEDKNSYILNGQKMWISNAGFADLFIVFAKIENDKYLSAFIVEKGFGGITMNPEEKKLGIKGSSTRQVFFNDCVVPVENLLGEREFGFKIALNILNIGRIKLGAATVGGSKLALKRSIRYSNERKQFGTSIGNFGAIKHKLAEMATRIYACESAVYRTGKNIEDTSIAYKKEGLDEDSAKNKAVEEFAIECAILKVHGSELLDFAVDETVQIHGGIGYSSDGPAERGYRDARINRIYEGTNEINRLVTIDILLKKAMKGSLDLMTPAMEVQKELTSIPSFDQNGEEVLFFKEKKVLSNLKKIGLMISGTAVLKLSMKLKEEQEILMNLADMLIEGYLAESSILRVEKLAGIKGIESCQRQIDMAMIYLHSAVNKITIAAKEAIYAFAEGDEQRMLLLGLKRFSKIEPYNLKEARRRIAEELLDRNDYCF